jgi:hypothetical protein
MLAISISAYQLDEDCLYKSTAPFFAIAIAVSLSGSFSQFSIC